MIKKLTENTSNNVSLQELLNNIDFSPLYNYICNYLKIPMSSANIRWEIRKNYRNHDYIMLNSDNLQYRCGILSPIFEQVNIISKNSDYTLDENGNIRTLWFIIDFAWEYCNRGSNGCEFAQAHYSNGKWEIHII